MIDSAASAVADARRSDQPRHRDLRLLPVAVGTWIAALGAIAFPEQAQHVPIMLWLFSLLSLLWAICAFRSRALATIVMLTALAAALVVSHVHLLVPERERAGEMLASQQSVTGKVVTKVEMTPRGGWRWQMMVSEWESREGTIAERALLRVEVDELPESGTLDLDSEVRIEGARFQRDDLTRASVGVLRSPTEVVVVREPDGVFAAASDMRTRFTERARGLEGYGGQLLPGLAVGDTRLVAAELDTAMKVTSLSHLTAVSGANCSLIVAGAFGISAFLGAGRTLRIAVSIAALAGFVILVTPEASVVRAATMAALALAALAFARRGVGISVLSLAVVILLISDPWLASSIGFALSAAATASLLLFGAPLASGLEKVMPRSLALLLAIPIAAQLACGPLLILIEPSVPVWGVLANVIAAPAAAPATVIGVLACLFEGVPGMSDVLFFVAWLPSSWVAATGIGIAGLPLTSLPWQEGLAGALFLSLLGALLLFAMVPMKARWGSYIARGVLALLLGGVFGNIVVDHLFRLRAAPEGWSIAMCDIAQGDALIARSAGRTMMIDTGPNAAALHRCLELLSISHVNYLVLTHFDLDHVGGYEAILGRVDTVLYGVPDEKSDVLLSHLEENGAAVRSVARGDVLPLGEARATVLWPRARENTPGNDASVVLDVRGGGMPSVLFLGDTSENSQRAMHAVGVTIDSVEVVKIAHHGSADQDPAFYERLGAAIALVSSGAGNSYGHPRKEALEMVDGAVILRTDHGGTAVIGRDEHGLWSWQERVGAPG